MKLYSRGQVLLCAILGGVLAALLVMIVPKVVNVLPGLSGNTVMQEADDELLAVHPLDFDQPIDEVFPMESSGHMAITGQTVQSSTQYTDSERENITIYERLNAAVVNITTETMAFNWFLEPVPQAGSSGSGSIIDARGYVLTNNHVIRNAHKVFINLADGSQFEGTVIGTDPDNDIAVLKFDPPRGMELQIIPFGSSDNLRVGQKVLAIGNPFAL